MGQAVVRLGDKCSGACGGAPRPNIEASPNVFVNGIPLHRVGDNWATHRIDGHGGITIRGSSSVFCNGKAVARIGDPISCGSFCGEGSPDVFAG